MENKKTVLDFINNFDEETKKAIEQSPDELQKSDFEQQEREDRWKAKRIGKITSSSLPKLMSFKKDGSLKLKAGSDYLLEILHQKETGEDENFASAPAMRWGHEYESMAHDYYRKVTGIDMISGTDGFDDILFIDDVIEGFGDSPDGMTADGKGCVEYKCPYNGANHLRNMALESFNDTNIYFWQVMGHILKPSIEWCDFVSFDPRYPDGHKNKIKILRVYKGDVLPRLAFLREKLEIYTKIIKEQDLEKIINL